MLNQDSTIASHSICQMAEKIRSRGLAQPVSFLFESHIPAFSVLYSIFLCTEPFILPFVSNNFRGTLHSLYQNEALRTQLLEELRKEN